MTATIKLEALLEAWRDSMLSYEWLDGQGAIKPVSALKPAQQSQRRDIEHAMTKGQPLPRPILGIGIMDNIEIGAGRATIAAAAVLGYKSLEVHLPKADEAEFKAILA